MQGASGWPRSRDLTRRLPVEIIATIFHYWKDSCPSNRYGLRADWVRATWICKRWREIALETPVLWSSIVISRPVADDPVLEMQLDRARGTALDLVVVNPQNSRGEVEDGLELVLAKKSPVKKLKIDCVECHSVVKEFMKTVAPDVESLSVYTLTWGDDENRWPFSSDVFPRLRCLVLSRVTPIPGAPLLHLTRLELTHALDEKAVPPRTGIHRFLAACPNLEVLHMESCFTYEYKDIIDGDENDVLPVVTLPKLRSLSVDQLGFDIATAVGTLRLPALSTFHIAADCVEGFAWCTFFVIPQNITEALPPIRRSRCLSLIAGGDVDDLSLRGSSDAGTFHLAMGDGDGSDGDGDDGQWSVTISSRDDAVSDNPDHSYFSCCIREFCAVFVARIPDLIVPSDLVCLQLHVSDGLPVARDWARFFAAMPHLRTLGIGSSALIRLVLAAFEADPGLCPELEELELCVGAGLDAEGGGLVEFVLQAFGAWVRGRATPLRALTVQTRTDTTSVNSDSDDSDVESTSASDSTSQSDEDLSDGAGAGSGTESSDLAWKLCQDIGLTLKASVRKVFLVGTDCPACSVAYSPDDWDLIRNDELQDRVTYY